MSIIVEIVQLVSTVVMTIVAVATVFLGYMGFHKWQVETVGRRKIELAEELLTSFYKFREVVKHARTPVTKADEGRSRVISDVEAPNVATFRNWFYTPQERLHAEQDFLATFFAARHKANAHFGPEIDRLFTIAEQALLEVRAASRQMSTMDPDKWGSPEIIPLKVKMGFLQSDDDMVGSMVSRIIDGAESVLLKHILRE